MTITIVLNREQLITELKAQREKAEAYDAEQAARFLEQRKAEHREFKELLKEALKWDTETAAKRSFCAQLPYERRTTTTSCPRLQVTYYDRALAALERDHRVKFRLNPGNTLHDLLTWNPTPPPTTLCD